MFNTQLISIHRLCILLTEPFNPADLVGTAKTLDGIGITTLMFCFSCGLIYILYKQQARNEQIQKDANNSKDEFVKETLKTVSDSISELSKSVSDSISESVKVQRELQTASDDKITKALIESRKEVVESRKEEREFFSQLFASLESQLRDKRDNAN
jgi:hypothetical protein